jgi:hypothetical protein
MLTAPACPQPVTMTSPVPRTFTTRAWSSRISGSGSQVVPVQCWCWGHAVFEVGGAVDLPGDQDRAVDEQRRLAALDHVEAFAGQRTFAECRPVVGLTAGRGEAAAPHQRVDNHRQGHSRRRRRPTRAFFPHAPGDAEAAEPGLRVQSLLLASGEPGGTFGEATSSLHRAPLTYRRAIAICG